jgi:hypothetical protein
VVGLPSVLLKTAVRTHAAEVLRIEERHWRVARCRNVGILHTGGVRIDERADAAERDERYYVLFLRRPDASK